MVRGSVSAGLLILLVTGSLIGVPAATAAQYFGANKVQYLALDFHVLPTEHFDIYFHVEKRAAVDIAARLAERWWARLSRLFGSAPAGRQPLVLYGSHAAFEQTLIVPDLIDPATGGLTERSRRRIAMPMAGSLSETEHVLAHELVHAFQFDILAGSDVALPLWFVEGLAEFASLGAVNPHTAMWLRDAVRHDTLPSLLDLEDAEYFPYRWGHAFWAYVAGRWGDRTAADLFRLAGTSGVMSALDQVLGLDADAFAVDWHAALRAAYGEAEAGEAAGRVLVAARPIGGAINVGAALSPDGRWIAFLSERGYFSVDSFVADARTGEVVARLTNTADDPRYSSLQFIDSAAAWDPAGTRLAMATVTGGRAALALFAWPGGRRMEEIVVREVSAIFSPTWSPDGRAIAFSALTDGVTDLFIYDLDRASLRRLTDDPFADLQPAWEPGGGRIAFVTDRYTSIQHECAFGELRLAVVDASSGAVDPIDAFPSGKHISPQWTPDARELYFVSDHDGTSDAYVVAIGGGVPRRLTKAGAGVSGITATSPAISVAARHGAAVITVFRGGRFSLHRIDDPRSETVDLARAWPPAELPPLAAPAATGSDAYWRSVTDSVRPPGDTSRYRPRLALERVSEATLGVGASRVGATVGSGVGLVLSDMLNTHSLMTAVQLNYGFSVTDAALFVAYLNQTRRWNWGVVGSAIPSYLGVASSDADPLLSLFLGPVDLIRQTERIAAVTASYAFNRARRIELQAAASRVAFDRWEGASGTRIDWSAAASPLTLGTGAVAFVHDTTSRAGISVARGERYRLEAAPTLGTVRYVTVLADYRRYVMPRPFYTIAARALHFARYGAGADDPRIAPLYLGYPSLVRGYGAGSHVESRCVAALADRCDDVEPLLGSRLAVGNLEFRLPLLRPLGISPRMYGPIPVEVAAFADGGVVWRGSPVTGTPGLALSAGVALRTSLAGLGLSQVAIARPLHGRAAGWVLQFTLAPPL